MKTLKQNAYGILLCLFEVLVGILLLIDPIGFTSGIIIAAGMVLLIIGIIRTVQYFQANAFEAAVGQLLMRGLVALLAGGFCVLKSHWFVDTFPVLTILYGIVILVAGLGKVQLTVDMIRLHSKKWFLGAISAAITILCAIVILNNPFASTLVLWQFTGILLIVEAVLDLIAFIIARKIGADL